MNARFPTIALLVAAAALPLAAQARTALVIGNGAYTHLPRLGNPGNDATDVGAALRSMGFKATVLLDAGQAAMEEAVLAFRAELLGDPSGAGVFFFAGHGIQSQGVNYLVPVDAEIQAEAQLKRKALPAQEVLEYMNEAHNRFNMVVLDACRNNPLTTSFRSGSRGLAVVGQAPPESLIVYSTDAGAVAEDGTGRNSPFTAAFLSHIGTPGLDVEAMVRRVTADVKAATGNRQTPYKYSSLSSDFAFVAASAAQPAAAARPPAAVATLDMVLVEGGTFRMGDAFDEGDADEDPAHSVSVSSFYIARTEVTVGDFGRFVEATGYRTTAEREGGGVVLSGVKWGEKDGASWRDTGFQQSDRQPVVMVSWFDAAEFCNWLSRKHGLTPFYSVSEAGVTMTWGANGYRLPTEAEWEYAARGGDRSLGVRFAGDGDPGTVAWYIENSRKSTHGVCGKDANELGICDMTGNAWEWCNDWYADYSADARQDPRGPVTGERRVVRGGGWNHPPIALRVANREELLPGVRTSDIGFRPVRPAR